MRRVDFGDRVTGRVVHPETWRSLRPPRTATGVLVGMFPQAPAGPGCASPKTSSPASSPPERCPR